LEIAEFSEPLKPLLIYIKDVYLIELCVKKINNFVNRLIISTFFFVFDS